MLGSDRPLITQNRRSLLKYQSSKRERLKHQTVKLIKWGHVLAAILLSAYGFLGFYNMKPWVYVWWPLLLMYYFLIAGVFRGRIWSIRLSIMPPLLAFLITAPMVTMNIFMFITGHELYRDSPATIFIVGVVAILVTMPSFLVLILYWRNRQFWLTTSRQ